jgi:hypothetical protein
MSAIAGYISRLDWQHKIRYMQEQRRHSYAEYVRVLGYFSLGAAACLFLLYLANLRAHVYYGAKHLSFLGYIAAYALGIGWGLVRLRKWAAVMLALPLCAAGLILGTLTIAKGHSLSSSVLAVGWAALLCCPAVLAVRAWHGLT